MRQHGKKIAIVIKCKARWIRLGAAKHVVLPWAEAETVKISLDNILINMNIFLKGLYYDFHCKIKEIYCQKC
jgi:hypothetical protein